MKFCILVVVLGLSVLTWISKSCAENIECDESGKCTCEAGYYGKDCTKVCPANCIACGRQRGECLKCMAGYFGSKCHQQCSNCLKRCDQETGFCIRGCKKAYHGKDCMLECPENCHDPVCSMIGGACYSCKHGYFGTLCDKPCLGHCAGGCGQTSGRCLTCPKGYYGIECNTSCPDQCVAECERHDGICAECQRGFYGETCQLSCPPHCGSGRCNKESGHCHRCEYRRYGSKCEHICECKDDCDREGKCVPKSNVLAGKTSGSASPPGSSNIIDEGLSSTTDERKETLACPENCNDDVCSSIGGECYSCKHGYYGTLCEKLCLGHCAKGCDQTSGHCLTCQEGYYGIECQTSCPDQCVAKCNRLDGKCAECQRGFYGETCQLSCPPHCGSGRCKKESGICHWCEHRRYGSKCENTTENLTESTDSTTPQEIHGPSFHENGTQIEIDGIFGHHGETLGPNGRTTPKPDLNVDIPGNPIGIIH